ncbi:MAG: extracellular solute-binding protein [Anaeroplasmataceae bacterium]
MKSSKSKLWSKLIVILFFVIFYSPLISLIIFSFNDKKSLTSWGGFTLKWYENLFTNMQIFEIILTTLFIAVAATVCALVIGTFASIALVKMKKKNRNTLLAINNLPITNPDIVIAIGLLLLFVTVGVERGYGTMLLAHISFCTPFVIITVYPKIKSLDPNLIEAAMDLGATPVKAIRSAIIPQIKTAIFASAAISFTMSFDDFVISYFTGGKSLNISTYLYTNAKKLNPTFNALSTIIILIIVAKIIYDVIKKRKEVETDYVEVKSRNSILVKRTLLISFLAVMLIAPFSIGMFDDRLYVFNAGEYIDNDSIDGENLIKQFEKEYGVRIVYNTYESNESALSKLETEYYDVVVLSDYAIEQMIKEDRLLEMDWSKFDSLDNSVFTSTLQTVMSDLKSKDDGYDLLKYAVPYFFGSVGIIYNKDTVSKNDLDTYGWNMFHQSGYNVSFYDSARDAYMVALKALGYSANSSNKNEIDEATNWLKKMKSITNPSFKTDELLDELPNGLIDLSFIYSGDANYVIQTAKEQGVNLGYYIPEQGTNIFMDAMVVPKDANNPDLAYKFIEFMSDPDNAYINSEYVCYSSSIDIAYNKYLEEYSDFAEVVDVYTVKYNSNDEVFRYNPDIKSLLTTLWSEIKI